ncbi:MAG: hypothetical protein AB1489_07450 [Acidobacteriota bacterium]
MIVMFFVMFYSLVYEYDRQSLDPQSMPVQIQLSVEKEVYYIAEPIHFRILLYNNQGNPIKGYFQLSPSLVSYRHKGDPNFSRYMPAWIQIMAKNCVVPTELLPNSRWEGHGKLFYDTQFLQPVLANSGEYEIKVEFNDTENNATIYESNTILVKVLRPPEKENSALADLRDQNLAKFLEGDARVNFCKTTDGKDLLIQDNHFQVGVEKTLAFLERHPQSLYTPIVKKMFVESISEEYKRSKGKLSAQLQAIYDYVQSSMRK